MKITKDGDCTVDPPYLLVFVPEFIVVVTPFCIFCQYTLVSVGLAVTVQPSVTVLPRFTVYDGFVTVTVGTSAKF